MLCDLSLFELGSVQNCGSSRAALSKVLDLFDRRQFPLGAGVRLTALSDTQIRLVSFARSLCEKQWSELCVLSVGIQGVLLSLHAKDGHRLG
jgi:hypothetical protein